LHTTAAFCNIRPRRMSTDMPVPPEASLSPQLAVRRGREATEFYKTAFGAREDYRVGGTDQHQEVVAQLSGTRPSGSPTSPRSISSPESLGGATTKLPLVGGLAAAALQGSWSPLTEAGGEQAEIVGQVL
jgi:hypothetical protein